MGSAGLLTCETSLQKKYQCRSFRIVVIVRL